MTYILGIIALILIIINGIYASITFEEFEIVDLDLVEISMKLNKHLLPIIITTILSYFKYGLNTTITLRNVIDTLILLYIVYMILIIFKYMVLFVYKGKY